MLMEFPHQKVRIQLYSRVSFSSVPCRLLECLFMLQFLIPNI
uniref:Uncharacterized protein n=1 Tax=Anguilla anguilla TaxID=7936 RepID=A0A0E9UER8_ANGAN